MSTKKSPNSSKSKGKSSDKEKGNKAATILNPIFEYLKTAIFTYPGLKEIHSQRKCQVLNVWNNMRPLWYGQFNKPTFTHAEWFWTPYAPLITSQGQVWVTDPPNKRIFRYEFCPFELKLTKLQPFILNGQPRQLCELGSTCRIGVIVTYTDEKKTEIRIYDLNKIVEEEKPVFIIDIPFFKWTVGSEPKVTNHKQNKSSKSDSDKSTKRDKTPEKDKSSKSLESASPSRKNKSTDSKKGPGEKNASDDPNSAPEFVYELEDWSAPVSICANSFTIFVAIHPLQAIHAYDIRRFEKVSLEIVNYCHNMQSCLNMDGISGIAATDEVFYLVTSRTKKVIIFRLGGDRFSDRVVHIEMHVLTDVTIDRLGTGTSIDINVDPFQILIVSDYKNGMVRTYNYKNRCYGFEKASLPNGELSYMGSSKFDPLSGNRLGFFSISKNGIMAMIDRNANKLLFFYDQNEFLRLFKSHYLLNHYPSVRAYTDPLIPIKLPAKQWKSDEDNIEILCDPDRFPPIGEDYLITPCILEKFARKTKTEDITKDSKSKSKKDVKGKNSKEKSGSDKTKSKEKVKK